MACLWQCLHESSPTAVRHAAQKNHLRARFCNECGSKLNENRGETRDRRVKLHADIAHPINSACRQMIQTGIEKAYHQEKEKSTQPGYQPPRMDFDDEYFPATHSEYRSSTEPCKADTETQLKPEIQAENATKPEASQSSFSDGIL